MSNERGGLPRTKIPRPSRRPPPSRGRTAQPCPSGRLLRGTSESYDQKPPNDLPGFVFAEVSVQSSTASEEDNHSLATTSFKSDLAAIEREILEQVGKEVKLCVLFAVFL